MSTYYIVLGSNSWGGADYSPDALANWLKQTNVDGYGWSPKVHIAALSHDSKALDKTNCYVNGMGNVCYPEGAELKRFECTLDKKLVERHRELSSKLEMLEEDLANPVYEVVNAE